MPRWYQSTGTDAVQRASNALTTAPSAADDDEDGRRSQRDDRRGDQASPSPAQQSHRFVELQVRDQEASARWLEARPPPVIEAGSRKDQQPIRDVEAAGGGPRLGGRPVPFSQPRDRRCVRLLELGRDRRATPSGSRSAARRRATGRRSATHRGPTGRTSASRAGARCCATCRRSAPRRRGGRPRGARRRPARADPDSGCGPPPGSVARAAHRRPSSCPTLTSRGPARRRATAGLASALRRTRSDTTASVDARDEQDREGNSEWHGGRKDTRCAARASKALRRGGDVGDATAARTDEVVWPDRKDGVGQAGGRPQPLVGEQVPVDQDGERSGVAEWRNPADREAGRGARLIPVGAADARRRRPGPGASRRRLDWRRRRGR